MNAQEGAPRSHRRAASLALLLGGCAGSAPTVAVPLPTSPASAPVAPPPPVVETPVEETITESSAVAPAPPPATRDVAELLFPGEQLAPERCPGDEATRTRCLLDERFEGDVGARDMARRLFSDLGVVAGVERDHVLDGGYRGLIHLVPAPPIGGLRVHLAWVSTALRDIDAFVGELRGRAKEPLHYGARPLAIRFFLSKGHTTPAMYAEAETVAYNVVGSLNTSGPAVRETLFHELFHLADQRERGWSDGALAETHAAILARCGRKTACLAPFAPHDTQVRGGTYYAFQPGNGPSEYAAELAVRYFRETRAALAGKRFATAPFKCGPTENARAWSLLVATFFGGLDLTPPCDGAKAAPAAAAAGAK